MQSMNLESDRAVTPPSCFGKTSPESSAQRTTPSAASWESLLEQTLPYHPEQTDGRVRVWLPDPSAKPRGESSTLNISESPNDVVVSSLSQVLERSSIPQKYFLSARACAGILRRAEVRGKELPTPLKKALEETATSGSEKEGSDTSGQATPLEQQKPAEGC